MKPPNLRDREPMMDVCVGSEKWDAKVTLTEFNEVLFFPCVKPKVPKHPFIVNRNHSY